MKYSIYAVAVLMSLSTSISSAKEIDKGTIMLGGEANLEYFSGTSKPEGSTSSDVTNSQLEFNGAYTIIPNLAAGLHLNRSDYESKTSGSKFSATSYSVGPLIFYHIPINKQMNFVARGGVNILSSVSESGGTKSDSSGNGWYVGGGAHYFITDNLAGTIDLSYTTYTLKKKSTSVKTTSSSMGVTAGLMLYLDN